MPKNFRVEVVDIFLKDFQRPLTRENLLMLSGLEDTASLFGSVAIPIGFKKCTPHHTKSYVAGNEADQLALELTT